MRACSYHLDPEKLRDQDDVTEWLSVLGAIAGRAHICLLGSGMDLLLESISVDYALRLADADNGNINSTALYLLKRGFPYVSVIRGGWISCYQFMENEYVDAFVE